jgi:hypothetical protein
VNKIPYTITGTVIDATSLSPLVGVEVSYKDNSALTNTKGYFTLVGEIEENEFIILKISTPNYTPSTSIPYNINIVDGLPSKTPKLKPDVGIIKLIPTISSIKTDKLDSLQYSEETIKSLSSLDSSLLQQKSLNKVINDLKLTLIPMVLEMLFEFGITKAMDFIKGKIKDINPICPENPEKIKELIRRRNKLVNQLNNLYKVVDTLTISLGLINNTVTTAEILFNTLKFTPIPTPPPAVPSLVPLIQDTKSTVDSNIKKFSNISKGLLTILIIIRDLLQQILDLLSLLDENIQKCTSDADLIGINQELRAINAEQQQSSTTQQSTQQNIQINGFNFGIETEPTTNNLKRKRAIAKNDQGVILLRGEYSFSSSDQILINELVFYIQTNNLKAD